MANEQTITVKIFGVGKSKMGLKILGIVARMLGIKLYAITDDPIANEHIIVREEYLEQFEKNDDALNTIYTT